MKNVGLGTGINIEIQNITVGNRILDDSTNTNSCLIVTEDVGFRIILENIELAKNQVDQSLMSHYNEFLSGKHGEHPCLNIEFDIVFCDLIGNDYMQHVYYQAQLMSPKNSINTPRFNKFDDPILI